MKTPASLPVRAALCAALVVVALAGVAAAQPVLTSLTPGRTPANTGAVVTIFGSGIGNAADQIIFPGPATVLPSSWGAGWVNVVVPATWSGNVQVRSGATGLLSSNSLAIDITYNWARNQWAGANQPFTWFLNQNGAPGCTVNETFSALAAGYNAWSCASGVSMSYGGTTATGPTSQTDGVNVLGWTNSGWSSGTIAVCSWRYWTATGNIDQYDIAFNAQHFTWSCTGAAGAMDVGNIGTHEQGHSIGFLDLYGGADFNDTMYGFGANGETIRRSLNVDDVEGAEFVYPHAGRANFAGVTPAGWSATAVPRVTTDSSPSYAPVPATLPGNGNCYVNFAVRNWGSDCAAPGGINYGWLDGDNTGWWFSWGGVWGNGADLAWTNYGPWYVRGGRHTLEFQLDGNNETIESNEGDNWARAQFVWSPYALTDQVTVGRVVPPQQGVFSYPNSDGFQFTGNWWGAVGIIPLSAGDDYDLRLHDDYTGATAGFGPALRSSASGGTYTDFVLIDNNNLGYGSTRWAGVIRYTAGAGGNYAIQQSNQVGSTLYPATTYAAEVSTGSVGLGAYEILKVHEVYLGDTATTYRFTLDNLSGTADLDFAIYNETDSYFGKNNYAAASWGAQAGGDEFFTYQPPSTGYYGVVVFKKGAGDYYLGNTYELRVGRALANLYTGTTPAGWSTPTVPRSAADATGGSALLTSTLPGNSSATYLNYATDQQGPGATPGWGTRLYLDEETYLAWSAGPDPSNPGVYVALNIGPVSIPGGRHTLTHIGDYDGVVPESNEYDNEWRGQWVWAPLGLLKDTPVYRYAPPPYGYFAQPNSDGAAFTRTAGYAWVTALAPLDPSDDYDLYLYDDYAGAASGFSNLRAYSAYGGNATEFVVGHYSGTPATVYPAAVRYWAGSYSFNDFDQSDAYGRNGGGAAAFTAQTLAASRLADVYEAYLTAGETYRFRLTRTSGSSDLEVALFPATSGGIYARWQADAYGAAYTPDVDQFLYSATTTGWHPVVVFRSVGTDAGEAATYDLEWGAPATTDIPDDQARPAVFAFRASYPNPSPGRTTLAFSLPATDHVALAVYDVRGRLVARLADTEFPAGEHLVAWDGRDQSGSPAPSGVYYARLAARGEVLTRRLNVVR